MKNLFDDIEPSDDQWDSSGDTTKPLTLEDIKNAIDALSEMTCNLEDYIKVAYHSGHKINQFRVSEAKPPVKTKKKPKFHGNEFIKRKVYGRR